MAIKGVKKRTHALTLTHTIKIIGFALFILEALAINDAIA